MKLFYFYSITLLVGSLMMSNSCLNVAAIEKFKSRTAYPAIASSVSIDPKIILLDWAGALKNIRVTENNQWESESQSVSFLNPQHVEMNAVFDGGADEIEIDVHVFSKMSNKDVFEKALIVLSKTSMTEINIKHDKEGSCDIYLYRDKYAICVYRNIIIEISATNKDIDLKYIIKNVNNIMNRSLTESGKSISVEAVIVQPKGNIGLDEEFTVDVMTTEGNNYEFKLHDSNNEYFDLIKQSGSKFYLKAKKCGSFIINLGVMNNKTLISMSIPVEINVIEQH